MTPDAFNPHVGVKKLDPLKGVLSALIQLGVRASEVLPARGASGQPLAPTGARLGGPHAEGAREGGPLARGPKRPARCAESLRPPSGQKP